MLRMPMLVAEVKGSGCSYRLVKWSVAAGSSAKAVSLHLWGILLVCIGKHCILRQSIFNQSCLQGWTAAFDEPFRHVLKHIAH